MRLSALGRSAIFAIFLATGIGKLFALDAFRASLDGWTIIPAIVRPFIDYAIPILEITLGVAWFIGVPWRVLRYPLAALVVGLTGAYVAQISLGPAPDCECWGIWARYVELRQTVVDKLVMASGMIGIVALCWNEPASPARETEAVGVLPAPTRDDTAGSAAKGARGFTIVELLVVIAVLAVLVGLALPLLRQVRSRGDLTAQLAKMNDHARVMHLYAGDYKETWPTLNPKAPDGVTTWTSPVYPNLGSGYFALAAGWPKLLFLDYYDGNLFHPSFKALRSSEPPITSFYLTQSIWAEPEFWRPDTRTGPRQWRGTRVDEVAFPSNKALLVNFVEPPDGSSVEFRPVGVRVIKPVLPLASVDGAARGIGPDALIDGYPTGTGTWPGSYLTFAHPGMHTIDGVKGRDVR